MLRVALIPQGVINHAEDKPSCIQSERYPIRGGLAEKQRLAQAFSVFEGIQEPFILSLTCKSVVLHHVYIHSFRKRLPGVGAFDHLEWTYDGAFEQLFGLGRGEFEQKFCEKYKCPGVARGGMLKLRFDWYITSNVNMKALNERIKTCRH